MSYVLPALKVHQEFEAVAEATEDLLYACIVAPNYGLHRYSETDEKAELGEYDPDSGSTFGAYPDKDAGSVVDVASNKLYIENGVLQYLTELLAGGPTDGLLVDGGNKIRSAGLVFKTLNGYTRSTEFGTRDVAVGDPIVVTWGVAPNQTIDTTISGFIAEEDAATTAALAVVTDYNQAETESVSDITLANPLANYAFLGDASGYDGLADGVLNESYVCTVISTDGTVANTYVRVLSASGLDDQASVQLSASGVPTAIGARGAAVTITETVSGLTDGDKFTLNISQAYSEVAPTSGGTYTGAVDTKYIIRITNGGTVDTDTDITFQVFTSDGSDSGDSTVVAAAGAFAVGSFGVEVTFASGAPLLKGAEYTIDVTAAGEGAIKTLILADSLTDAVQADTLTVDFRLKADFELEDAQWTADGDSIEVYSNAEHVGSYLGSVATFDIKGGTLFIDYRELLADFINKISSIQSVTEAEAVCGPAVVANPLGLMVNKAIQNSNGVEVYFIATETDNDSGYIDAINALSIETEPYSIVPYSNSLAVRDAVKAHCLDMSTPEKGQWRIWWISAETDKTVSIYTELSGGGDIQATIADNGSGKFTKLNAVGALFITNGLLPGDTIRTNYATDAYGNQTYEEYTADSIDSEEDITLLKGPAQAIISAVKMEVWRTADRTEYADEISTIATNSNHRRGYAVWSEGLYDGLNPDGMPVSTMCAALAGLRSGVAPHQPLTNVSISGFSMERSVAFRRTQLDTMAGNGIWLVVQTLSGEIYTRHQVSTDNEDINMREQTITTNLDDISRAFKTALSGYYGRGNVSDAMLELIRYTAEQQFTVIGARPYPDTIGPQLQGADITKLEINPVLRDAIDLVIEPALPYPLNNLNVYFIIS